jgi:hypothetical protein
MCIGVQIMQEDRIVSVTIGLYVFRPIDPGPNSKLGLPDGSVRCVLQSVHKQPTCLMDRFSVYSLLESGDAKPVSS